MAQKRAAWGIDIGQSSLKAIKLQYSDATDQVVAVAFDFIQYPKILSQPDAIPEEIIAESMKTFLTRNSIKDDLIAISVPGHSSLARFIQLPPVEASKLAEIVKYEARQQIPFALEEVIWDFQPLGAGVEEGGYLLDAEVGLFAMKRDQVMNAMRPFTSNKLEIELVQTAPLALYNVLSFDELGIRRGQPVSARDEYTIVLDMGCDNTTLMISNGAKIWIRNVPIGGNHFTRALTKEMKLSFAKAELLKCNATKSPDPRAVFQALRPVFNDYVSEIQRSIGYFSSVNRQAKVSKVLGLGNGFKLAGLQKFLQQNLQYDVEKPDAYHSLAGDSVINAPLFSDNVLSFAVPYGLALQALDVTRIRTTLLPPEIASARIIRRKKPWAAMTAAMLLVAASLGVAASANSYSYVHSKVFEDAEKAADGFASEISGKRSAYEGEKGNFTKARQDLEALVVGRRGMDWMELFNAVNDCLPRDGNAQQDEIPLTQRNQVSISHLTARREGDVGAWFTSLPDQSWLAKADRENAPSGSGYIVTLIGKHWHSDPDPEQNDILYLRNNFLRNLQQPTVQQPGYPPRDITRMGISHATIVEYTSNKTWIPKSGLQEIQSGPRVNITENQPPAGARSSSAFDGDSSLFGPGPIGAPSVGSGGSADSMMRSSMGGMRGAGGASFGQTTRPMDPENYDEVEETQFKIEFVFKYKPKSERTTPAEESAEDAGE
ncbi:MAG: type IV pilus assembly protein PilM [Planctomyces sp.]|nr:type IV pilus assembly protein PilM [Planctomyces sp.]